MRRRDIDLVQVETNARLSNQPNKKPYEHPDASYGFNVITH